MVSARNISEHYYSEYYTARESIMLMHDAGRADIPYTVCNSSCGFHAYAVRQMYARTDVYAHSSSIWCLTPLTKHDSYNVTNL